MKVILKEYVYKHGVAGDVVTVADGFARNYLLPRGLAVRATPGMMRENQHLLEQAVKNRERLRALESEAAVKIDGVELVFGMKAGKNRKLYGSVTTRDIAAALLEKTGVDINRRRISERALRELGKHEVPVRLGTTTSPVLKIVILREEEVPLYLEGKPVDSLTAAPETIEYVEEETYAEEAAEEAAPEAGESEAENA
ncbi:MAG: 50S ribosomal protein L9 [Chloroflexi bacterium]|nr:MAG: 50S ribosomal protein L9 [Chloroflexota bacterium]